MQHDNDFDPGLGLALSRSATVTTELQTAGIYLPTLLTNPPCRCTEGFVINTQTLDLHTRVTKPPADTTAHAYNWTVWTLK